MSAGGCGCMDGRCPCRACHGTGIRWVRDPDGRTESYLGVDGEVPLMLEMYCECSAGERRMARER